MTMMMDEEEPLFQDLLRGYVADTPDDGFVDQLVQMRQMQIRREKRIRRLMLGGAFFVGGLVAGSQFGKLANLLEATTLTTTFTSMQFFPYVLAMIFAFFMWLSLEGRPINL